VARQGISHAGPEENFRRAGREVRQTGVNLAVEPLIRQPNRTVTDCLREARALPQSPYDSPVFESEHSQRNHQTDTKSQTSLRSVLVATAPRAGCCRVPSAYGIERLARRSSRRPGRRSGRVHHHLSPGRHRQLGARRLR
jgi:hypothetical protein